MTHPFYRTAFWRSLRSQALKRDGYRCTVPGCDYTTKDGRLIVDHVVTRPPVTGPCGHDVLSNLRTLCPRHDGQIKEQAGSGKRRKGGLPVLTGCDANGLPLDPDHFWRKSGAATVR